MSEENKGFSYEGNKKPESDKESSDDEPVQDVASTVDSSKPSPPSISSTSAPLEGAVGGEVENPGMVKLESSQSVSILNRQATSLDKKHLSAGKLDVFRKFFNQDDLEFFTRPEGRRRHRAQRQRHYSEGSCLQSEPRSLDENPLRDLQVLEPEPELVLNQAGAIIGICRRESDYEPIRGENGFDDLDHSLGSAETAAIGEVYAGNFTPSRPSSSSSRGLSSGSSFPSFCSRAQTSSDIAKVSLQDSGSSEGDGPASLLSADFESLPPEKPIRQRRFGISQPITVPIRSKSALACFIDDADKSPSSANKLERKLSKDASVCSEPLPTRKISKDSSVESSERISSEDEATSLPELSHSVESDSCEPARDKNQDTAENLQCSLDALRISAGIAAGTSADIFPNIELETEESESEPDPISVLSCSPDASKNSD